MSLNVSLTPQLEAMIHEKVASGMYASASEVIREALRVLDQQEKKKQEKLEWLRAAIQEGRDSGIGKPANEVFAELEKEIISHRTKEALKARKASGVALGKPKGTIQPSKYDAVRDRIMELRELGLSYTKICSNIGFGTAQSLMTYCKSLDKRKLEG